MCTLLILYLKLYTRIHSNMSLSGGFNGSLVEVASCSNTSNGGRMGVAGVVWAVTSHFDRLYETLVAVCWLLHEGRTGLAGLSHMNQIRIG